MESVRVASRGYEALILDFDGTMFRLFVNYDLAALSLSFHGLLGEMGIAFDEKLDPFDAFGVVSEVADPKLKAAALELVDVELEKAELAALSSGEAIAYCDSVLCELLRAGLPLAVATNNSRACVWAWLEKNLGEVADEIPVFGREPRYPEHLKPDPWTLTKAVEAMGVKPGACLFVGDSIRDFEAACACGCSFMGMAPTAAKRGKLLGFLDADDIVSDYRELRRRAFGSWTQR